MLQKGTQLPDATLRTFNAQGELQQINLPDYSAGKKIIVFALPGAFTPTCTKSHLPGYVNNASAIKAKGIDEIACLCVADQFVMQAWATSLAVNNQVTMLSDGNTEFTKMAGMDIDLREMGLGIRSKRYAMLISDGVVQDIWIEQNPGVAEISGADAILEHLG